MKLYKLEHRVADQFYLHCLTAMTLRDTIVSALVVTFVLVECKAGGIPFRDDEPGTIVTETRAGNFDQQLVIDHTKYDGPNDTPKKVVLKSHQQSKEPLDFDVFIPEAIGFDSAQYSDNKKQNTNEGRVHQPPDTDGGNYALEGKFSMPSDFQDEISGLNIPYTNPYATLPKELKDVGPPPDLDDHEDEDDNENEEERGRGGEEEEDDGSDDDNDEKEEEEETEKDYESPNYDHYFNNDFLEPYDFKDPLQSPQTRKPVNDQKPLKTTDFHVVIRDSKKPRVIASPPIYSYNTFSKYRPYSVYPRRKVVQKVSQNGSANKPPCVNCKHRKRKPRPPQKAQNIGKSLNDLHRQCPGKPQTSGNCGPRKIIKEIHFHHYDPQLSSQLGGIVPASESGNENEEREVIIHTLKMPKKKHNIYDSDYLEHDIELENAIKRHKLDLENHLKERKLSGFDKPMVHHRYGTPSGSGFHFDSHKRLPNLVTKHAPIVEKITVTPDGNGARYIKHQSVKYFYKTPNEIFK